MSDIDCENCSVKEVCPLRESEKSDLPLIVEAREVNRMLSLTNTTLNLEELVARTAASFEEVPLPNRHLIVALLSLALHNIEATTFNKDVLRQLKEALILRNSMDDAKPEPGDTIN